jgi:hypothetical protein
MIDDLRLWSLLTHQALSSERDPEKLALDITSLLGSSKKISILIQHRCLAKVERVAWESNGKVRLKLKTQVIIESL